MCTLYTLSDLIVLSTKISNGIYTYSLLERNGTTDKNNPKKKKPLIINLWFFGKKYTNKFRDRQRA